MSASSRQQLRQATEAAWKAARASTAGSAAEARPGELFVVPATSHLAVEWVVIELDPSAQRLYAVPADTWRQVGSHDVHIDADSPCGPLSLRCGLGLWLPPEIFAPDLRSGVVDRADLDRARQTWQAIEDGTVEVSESQHETDHELEYQDWINSGPAQARALLAGSSPGLRRTVPDAGLKSAATRRRYIALAASLLLAMTLAAGSIWTWKARTGNSGIDSITAPFTVTLLRTRGGVQNIVLPDNAGALELRLGDAYPEPYRVEIRSEDPPRTLQTSERAILILPRHALPPGEYRILVLATDNGQTRTMGQYRIEIEHQGQ